MLQLERLVQLKLLCLGPETNNATQTSNRLLVIACKYCVKHLELIYGLSIASIRYAQAHVTKPPQLLQAIRSLMILIQYMLCWTAQAITQTFHFRGDISPPIIYKGTPSSAYNASWDVDYYIVLSTHQFKPYLKRCKALTHWPCASYAHLDTQGHPQASSTSALLLP